MSDAYAAVTARVVEALERGTAPWRRPWHETSGPPANALTGRPYRGVNLVLLGLATYPDHRWLTFRQARELGGSVRRGERSTEVVFWKPTKVSSKEAGDAEEGREARRAPLLRFYRVFNAAQCEGLGLPPVGEEMEIRARERIPRAESVLRLMPDPPRVEEGHRGAWYAPGDDLVGLPPIGAFVSADYSREELVAELASAFACAAVGLDNSLAENSAAYVAGWLKALRVDVRAVVVAAGQAQRAAEWMLGRAASLAD